MPRPTTVLQPRSEAAPPPAARDADLDDLAHEVAVVLAGMSYEERVRAYRGGIFSARELSVAAARLPDSIPLLNGEYEWIAIDAE